MVESSQEFTSDQKAKPVNFQKYDRSAISYASTFEDPWKATFIRVVEAFTGKMRILRLVREFERRGAPQGQGEEAVYHYHQVQQA